MFAGQNITISSEPEPPTPGVETRTPGWITLDTQGDSIIADNAALNIKFTTKSSPDIVYAKKADNGLVSWDVSNLVTNQDTCTVEYISFTDTNSKLHNLKFIMNSGVELMSDSILATKGLDLLYQAGNIISIDSIIYTTHFYSFGFVATTNSDQGKLPIWDTINNTYSFTMSGESFIDITTIMEASNGNQTFPDQGKFDWIGNLVNASTTGSGDVEITTDTSPMPFKFQNLSSNIGFVYKQISAGVTTNDQCYLIIALNKSGSQTSTYKCVISRYDIEF